METNAPCTITILEAQPNCVWVRGLSEPFTFEALVYCVGSKHGIHEGRISKFAVWIDRKKSSRKHWIANYDRGWDRCPDEEHQASIDRFISLLEAMPEPEYLVANQTFELD